MSTQRISGKDFRVTLSDLMISVATVSLAIDDGRTAVMTNGIPDGYVDGDISGSGDIEVDSKNFALIVQAAKSAGSFKAMKPFDMMFFAQIGSEKMQIEAFGCLLKVDDLLSIDATGGDKTQHKLSFEITDSDFVKVNGVPYVDASELIGL